MRTIFNSIIHLLFLLCVLISSSAISCTNEEIKEIESCLNKLNKVIIPFTQTINNKTANTLTKGVLLIEKPFKFRVNYDMPHPLVIVGGKNYVSIYDYELEELSRVDAKDNLFKFLLELNVKLQKSVKIERCISNNNIELIVRHKKTDQQAFIRFSKSPIQLKEMIIPDDNNQLNSGVTLSLKEPRYVKFFNKDLFIIKDTKIYGAPKRFKSEEILKLSN